MDPRAARRRSWPACCAARRERLHPRRRRPPRRRSGAAPAACAARRSRNSPAISTTYYTFLEQGRGDIRPSPQVLDALAGCAPATPMPNGTTCTGSRPARLRPGPAAGSQKLAPRPSPTLVDRLDPHPTYVSGRRWDVLAANRAARELWADWPSLPPAERNIVWWTFMDPRARADPHRVGVRGVRPAGRFRAAAARHSGDPDFAELIQRLRAGQPGGTGVVAAARRGPAELGQQADPAPGARRLHLPAHRPAAGRRPRAEGGDLLRLRRRPGPDRRAPQPARPARRATPGRADRHERELSRPRSPRGPRTRAPAARRSGRRSGRRPCAGCRRRRTAPARAGRPGSAGSGRPRSGRCRRRRPGSGTRRAPGRRSATTPGASLQHPLRVRAG